MPKRRGETVIVSISLPRPLRAEARQYAKELGYPNFTAYARFLFEDDLRSRRAHTRGSRPQAEKARRVLGVSGNHGASHVPSAQ